MGDGRYYTFYQFFDVLWITILLVVSLFSIVRIYYRKHDSTKVKKYFLPLALIILFGLLRLIEQVYPNLDVAFRLRNTSLYVFLLILLTANLSKFRFKKSFYSSGILLILAAQYFVVLIKRYEFHKVIYKDQYKIILVVILFHMLAVSTVQLKHSKIKRVLPLLMTYILPVVLYIISVFTASNHVDNLELLTLAGISLLINLRFARSDESAYTVMAFNKIGNMASNYIFVVDESYQVIYRNSASKNAQVFHNRLRINVSDFQSLFRCESLKKYIYKGKEYIELKRKDEKYFYSFDISDLYEDHKLVGYTIIFVDITDLLALLIDLEDKKKESKQVNEKLMNYSQVVYHLEKEKEINKLLEEIVTSRDEQMKYLSQLVESAVSKLDDEAFEDCIEVAIKESNDILNDVRETVSRYRMYYGG